LAATVLVASIAVGFPVTVSAMLNERIGDPPLQAGLSSLLHPDRRPLQRCGSGVCWSTVGSWPITLTANDFPTARC